MFYPHRTLPRPTRCEKLFDVVTCTHCNKGQCKVQRNCALVCTTCGHVQEAYAIDRSRPMHHYVPHRIGLNAPRKTHRYVRTARLAAYVREVTGRCFQRPNCPVLKLAASLPVLTVPALHDAVSRQPRAYKMRPYIMTAIRTCTKITVPEPTPRQLKMIEDTFTCMTTLYDTLPLLRKNFISYAFVYYHINKHFNWEHLNTYVRLPTTPRILREYKSIMRRLQCCFPPPIQTKNLSPPTSQPPPVMLLSPCTSEDSSWSPDALECKTFCNTLRA